MVISNSLISFLLSLHSAFLSLNPGLEHIILFSCFVDSQHLLINQKDLIFQNIFMTAVITLLYIERNMLADIQQTFIEQLPWTGKLGQEEGYPSIPYFVWAFRGKKTYTQLFYRSNQGSHSKHLTICTVRHWPARVDIGHSLEKSPAEAQYLLSCQIVGRSKDFWVKWVRAGAARRHWCVGSGGEGGCIWRARAFSSCFESISIS